MVLQPALEAQPAGKVEIVEQDWTVVGLQPVVEVQPAGRIVVVLVEAADGAQGWPVVRLYPVAEVQPAGKATQDCPVIWL